MQDPSVVTCGRSRMRAAPGSRVARPTRCSVSRFRSRGKESPLLWVQLDRQMRRTDPLLRLWVRLHCRPVPPSVDEVAREVPRLPSKHYMESYINPPAFLEAERLHVPDGLLPGAADGRVRRFAMPQKLS